MEMELNTPYSYSKKDKLRTTIAVNLGAIIERADEQIVPAMYSYVGESFQATPAMLGVLTFCRAISQAVCSPVGGLLGYFQSRRLVLAGGCMLWGVMTVLFGFTNSLEQGMVIWAINGFGLSLVIPTTQSLTADYFSKDARGTAFGVLFFTGALGAMVGQLYATNLGANLVAGMSGWRFVMVTVGVYSMLIGIVAYFLVQDPRESHALLAGSGGPSYPRLVLRSAWQAVKNVLRIPTFLIIVGQGVFGSCPWQALVYLTHYLQLLGMSDFTASVLLSLFHASTAFGGVIGGMIGDRFGRKFPNHGRILICQFSVGVKLPFVVILMKFLPLNGEFLTSCMYGAVLVCIGTLGPWAAAACNNPIFAEIVPSSHRNMIYGFDRSFEGALAALTAPLVGHFAKVYGYSGHVEVTGNPEIDIPNARALGTSLFFWLMVPWSICLLLYCLVHITYPRDRARAAALGYTRLEMEEQNGSRSAKD